MANDNHDEELMRITIVRKSGEVCKTCEMALDKSDATFTAYTALVLCI